MTRNSLQYASYLQGNVDNFMDKIFEQGVAKEKLCGLCV